MSGLIVCLLWQVDMANEAARKDKEYKQQVEILNAQNKELSSSLEQLNDKFKNLEKGARGMYFNFKFNIHIFVT